MRRIFVLLPALALVSTGCGNGGEGPSPTEPESTGTRSSPSTTADESVTAPTAEESDTTGAASEMTAVVEASIVDLAARLSVDPETIAVVESREMTWPDASLGCPAVIEDGDDGPTDGYQVILEYQDRVYIFHAGTDGEPFLCPSDEKDGGRDFVPPPGIDQ